MSADSSSLEMVQHEPIHHTIQVDSDAKESWSIKGSCSIHRVPNCLRQAGKNAYVPQIVSIGPFHRSNKTLQAMNNNKKNYLRDVISWTQNNGRYSRKEIFDSYLDAVKSVEKKARACYSETINLNSNTFNEMMVIDGCFIIALLCKVANLITVHKDDPIFNMVWLWSKLQNDLLMFENQIPFIVLQRLFDLMKVLGGRDCPSLTRLALDFFQGLVPKIESPTKENPKIKPKHLLHLFHSSLLPTPKEDKPITKLNQREVNDFNLIKSTKALKKAGIKFKKAEAAESFFDVKFKDGIMEIPTVVIGESTNSVFLNLIAFEQCYSACTDHFTDYTAFMNCLINSAIDVGTLCQSGIIVNWLGRDHEVAKLFKMLAKTLTISTNKFYLSDVFWEINQHRQTTCGACMPSLKRFYFNSFWSVFPFGAAIILLVLTFLQTIFTMHAYYHPPS